ncbi:hypothetical protein DAI22_07g212500 [Oryza sativa Japonica Group]|nr:hypothetical protein DAI22_07g212500 [Oryza sativa Japonica Group]
MRLNTATASRNRPARENAETRAVYAPASGPGAASRSADASARRPARAMTRMAVARTRGWWSTPSPWSSRAAWRAASAAPGWPREPRAPTTAASSGAGSPDRRSRGELRGVKWTYPDLNGLLYHGLSTN